MTFDPAEVYRKQLQVFNDFGHALWRADNPRSRGDRVGIQIGDIGYFVNGSFKRLFNVIEPRQSDEQSPPGLKVMRDFKKQEIDKDDTWVRGLVHSDSVRTSQIGVEAGVESLGTLLPKALVQCAIDTAHAEGAVLYVEPWALKWVVERRQEKRFANYIKDNRKVLEALSDHYDQPIHLVSGYAKTAAWAAGAYRLDSSGLEASAKAGMSLAYVGGRWKANTSTGILFRDKTGPLPREHESNGDGMQVDWEAARRVVSAFDCDQCIVIYSVKSLSRPWWKRFCMKAAAGPAPLPDPDQGTEHPPALLVEAPAFDPANDPVDAVLDYILRNNPSVEVAITSHFDILGLFPDPTHLPSDFVEYLKSEIPRVHEEDGVGRLDVEPLIRRTQQHRRMRAHQHMQDAMAQQEQPLQPEAPPGPPGDEQPEPQPGEPQPPQLAPQRPPIDPYDTNKFRLTTTTETLTLPSGKTIEWLPIVLADPEAEGISINAFSVTVDGRRVAVAQDNSVIKLWDRHTGDWLHDLIDHEDAVLALDFSPDGTRLVSGGADNKALIWQVDTAVQRLVVLDEHEASVWAVAYSPDGSTIATVSFEVCVWTHEGMLKHKFSDNEAEVTAVQFSPDSKLLLASAGNVAYLWNCDSGQLAHALRGHEGTICGMKFAHAGDRIVTCADDSTSRVWSVTGGAELLILREHNGPVWAVDFSKTDKYIASGSYDSSISVCDSITTHSKYSIQTRPGHVTSLVYSHDGDWLATGDLDGFVRVWMAESGALVAEFKGHADRVQVVRWTSDDKSVISCSDDGTVRIWDFADLLRLPETPLPVSAEEADQQAMEVA